MMLDKEAISLSQQIAAHLAAIRNPIREAADRLNVELDLSLGEDAFTTLGGRLDLPVSDNAPWRLETLLVYSSAATCTLFLSKNAPKGIPLPTGITLLTRMGKYYMGGDRPYLSDSASNTTNILSVQGVIIPPKAMPL